MKIAVTADPELPVPPRLYGGIERIVDLLVRGLVARGHDVTLFAHPESASAGRLIPWPGRVCGSLADTGKNTVHLTKHIAVGRFDIVHSFSRVAYMMPILPMPIPKLMTYQRPISLRSVRLGHALSRGSLEFCAISRRMIDGDVGRIGRWHVVYNGVSMDTYNFVPAVPSDAPLAFLGRIEPIKGPHLAIELAKRAGASLVIAGNIPDEHQSFFAREIEPHIDANRVRYIGPVDDRQKSALLGSARALLMPILWEEPFGIVMAEALACGTPVLGFDRGAVAEVVEDGVTGVVRGDLTELVVATDRLMEIDRRACRARAERLFSGDALVDGYMALYQQMRGKTLSRRKYVYQ